MTEQRGPEKPEHDDADYSEVLAAYHESLVTGRSDEFDSTASHDLSGAIDCLKMMERNRQLSSGVNPNLSTGDWSQSSPWVRSPIRENVSGRIGRFEIVRTLGVGGSGIVLLALDPELNRQIALKVPTPEALLREEFVIRFQREAKIAARLKHPNIVQVLETGAIGPIHYIASDYCNGPNFDEWMKVRTSPLQPRVAAMMLRSLTSAIQHAHSRGVLHRDIKPANILFQFDDELTVDSVADEQLANCVRLADFGLAKSLTDSVNVTVTAAILGTPAYMSPEQASGEDGQTGIHSDVFSLGVVLYELVTGDSPFARNSSMATLNAVKQEQPKSISAVRNECPADLAAICGRCIEKRPADRYPTADALLDDLDRFIAGRPVAARPISTSGRVWRWAVRNRLLAMLISAVALLVVALAIGSTVAALLINSSREEAVEALANATAAHQLAEANAMDALKEAYTARLSHAKGVRLSNQMGQRNESLAAIDQAIPLLEKIAGDDARLFKEETFKLRNEFIAGRCLMDVSAEQSWNAIPGFSSFRNVRADADSKHFAAVSADGLEVTLFDAKDCSTLKTLSMPTGYEALGAMQFSPNGRYLALRTKQGRLSSFGQLWDINEAKVITKFAAALPFHPNAFAISCPFDFSPDSKTLAVCSNRKLQLLDIENEGRKLQEVSIGQAQALVRFSKDGKRLAVAAPKLLRLFNSDDFDQFADLKLPPTRSMMVTQMEWSPDGIQLAVARLPQTVSIHDTRVEGGTGGFLFHLQGHGSPVDDISFHQDYALIMTGSSDGSTRLWGRGSGNSVLTIKAQGTHFAADGRGIATRTGLHCIQKPDRQFVRRMRGVVAVAADDWHSKVENWAPLEHPVSVHPNGWLMVKADGRQIGFTNLSEQRLVRIVQTPAEHCLFSANGDAVLIRNRDGTFERRPLRIDESETQIIVRVGHQERMDLSPVPGEFSNRTETPHRFIVARVKPREVVFCDRLEQKLYAVKTSGAAWADISPNGQFLAISKGPAIVNLHKPATGEHLTMIQDSIGRAIFHPDGHTVVLSSGNGCRFYRTDDDGVTWKTIYSTEAATYRLGVPVGAEPAAFNGDGSMVAVRGRESIDFLDSTTFATLASFNMPTTYAVQSLYISPAADYLMVTPKSSPRGIWDLNRCRTALRKRNLDWSTAPLTSPTISTTDQPVTIEWHGNK